MRSRRWRVSESKLGGNIKNFLVIGIIEQAQVNVIERGVILGRALELDDIIGADSRSDEARQLRLRIARVPGSEDKRCRRNLGKLGRIAALLVGVECLAQLWAESGVAHGR